MLAKQRTIHDVYGLNSCSSNFGESRHEPIRILYTNGCELDSKGACCKRELDQRAFMPRHRGVPKNPDALKHGNGFFQQLEALGGYIGCHHRQARDGASRPSQRVYQP